VTPFSKFVQLLSCGRHFREDFFCVRQQLFSRLRENHGFAHSVQKATTHFLLQRFHGMADGRLGEAQFARGLRERTRPSETCEGAKLSAV
jgi:hypothetical protein